MRAVRRLIGVRAGMRNGWDDVSFLPLPTTTMRDNPRTTMVMVMMMTMWKGEKGEREGEQEGATGWVDNGLGAFWGMRIQT